MKYKLLLIITFLLALTSCQQATQKGTELTESLQPATEQVQTDKFGLPTWATSANIYEVNLRQYTKEGTFRAFMEHLPRLKEMGIDILWFMPIFPISEKNRKGSLGSYYAVSDYKAVNPEHGTMADFDAMVAAIHAQGMHLILDWVPNHTGWDHSWITAHKDWYTQDKNGNVIDPIDPGTGKSWGWTDVADLNYDNTAMRKEMISDMAYWVREKKIDGFRMDVAHNVPDDFWEAARDALYGLGRPIFMLAEAEMENHLNSRAFHANYGWSMHHLFNEIAKGEKPASHIDALLAADKKKMQHGFHIYFTSNHDENTWAGTVMDRMGAAHKPFAVLAATLGGMPLIYGGQEEPLKHRLEFFEKDDIGFGEYAYADFYKRLISLKHNNRALWNGKHGGALEKILEDNEQVYAFAREKDKDKVTCIFNLSGKPTSVTLETDIIGNDAMTDQQIKWKAQTAVALEPWQYYVISSKG